MSRGTDFMIDDMSLIRATSLQGYPDLVRALGGDPAALLRAARIPPGAVGDFDTYLGHRNVIAAIETAATVTGTPDFGRQLAERQGIEILGPVGAAARTARTVGEALAAFSDYLSAYSPSVRVAVASHGDPGQVVVDLRIALQPAPDHRQTTELTLGVALNILKLLLGRTYRPLTVHVPHAALTPARQYEAYYGAPARFAEPFCGFTIRKGDLDRQLTADGSVHQALRAYLDTVVGPGKPDTYESVQQLIRHLLPTGSLGLDAVADQLRVHPRTLQRRLARHGTTFEALVDCARKDLADRLLRDTDMVMSQLAGVLGYSEQSVLVWASRRWFGTTPTQHRRNSRRPPARVTG
jgi:AraC-like DNA-binding protein